MSRSVFFLSACPVKEDVSSAVSIARIMAISVSYVTESFEHHEYLPLEDCSEYLRDLVAILTSAISSVYT